ncbi:CBS domain-containing protein [Candidatus Woesearchaeota archaeon]|nr:CBS domain-containing protein [Candidatus Woesearchaeota archaeon]
MEKMISRYVKDYMTKKVISVSRDASVYEVAKKMSEKGISCIVVVEGTKPVGIITERDMIKRVITSHKDIKKIRVDEVMSKPIFSLPPDADIISAGESMKQKKVRKFPIVKDNKLVGVITETDVIQGIIKLVRHLNWELVTMKITLEDYIEKLKEIHVL